MYIMSMHSCCAGAVAICVIHVAINKYPVTVQFIERLNDIRNGPSSSLRVLVRTMERPLDAEQVIVHESPYPAAGGATWAQGG